MKWLHTLSMYIYLETKIEFLFNNFKIVSQKVIPGIFF